MDLLHRRSGELWRCHGVRGKLELTDRSQYLYPLPGEAATTWNSPLRIPASAIPSLAPFCASTSYTPVARSLLSDAALSAYSYLSPSSCPLSTLLTIPLPPLLPHSLLANLSSTLASRRRAAAHSKAPSTQTFRSVLTTLLEYFFGSEAFKVVGERYASDDADDRAIKAFFDQPSPIVVEDEEGEVVNGVHKASASIRKRDDKLRWIFGGSFPLSLVSHRADFQTNAQTTSRTNTLPQNPATPSLSHRFTTTARTASKISSPPPPTHLFARALSPSPPTPRQRIQPPLPTDAKDRPLPPSPPSSAPPPLPASTLRPLSSQPLRTLHSPTSLLPLLPPHSVNSKRPTLSRPKNVATTSGERESCRACSARLWTNKRYEAAVVRSTFLALRVGVIRSLPLLRRRSRNSTLLALLPSPSASVRASRWLAPPPRPCH